LRKAGFNPNEARVPAGHPDGAAAIIAVFLGYWTSRRRR
jgi:hypothetical protein